ncbi:AMP-binding protein [Flavobacterium sp. UBA7682]|uniref:AMP-binding protein n=1 Tax=Flavobacterium sp. UBA7682 TaxID=1946560 RepID=UPI0025BF146D|nr:AMP-binding protein [Flavobacterium sp. UBA7682]
MKDFIELIKNNAINYPDTIAVIEGERKISYADFLSLVNQFSHSLTKNCSNPRVVIDLKQGIESYALIVATLNVAGIYCPLNPDAPIDRKKQIISEFVPDFIIVRDDDQNKSELNPEKTLFVSELLNEPFNNSEIAVSHNPEDIIYVIYTSGSTGMPKGVKVCRKALNKFLEWSIPTYGANGNDVWGQFSYLSFDLSIVDIFTCLCSGATLIAMPDMTSKLIPTSAIQKYKITIWHSVPSAVDFMIERSKTKPIDISSIRLMTFCGEPLHKRHLDFLFDKKPTMSIYNTYGPTEGTLFCSWQKFEKDNYENFCNPTLSIGTPINGWNFKLKPLDDDSEAFEIIIYGDYIGKGYLGHVKDSKFVIEKIDGTETSAFQTGDIVLKKDNHLYYSSRIDRQIKVNGYRIEPDEIDLKITEFLNKPSVTILHQNFLYSLIETDEDFDESQLKDSLIKKIEPYKIPRAFIKIDKFPRSPNAKIDYNELLNFIKND